MGLPPSTPPTSKPTGRRMPPLFFCIPVHIYLLPDRAWGCQCFRAHLLSVQVQQTCRTQHRNGKHAAMHFLDGCKVYRTMADNVCVCICVCACVHACVRACVRACVGAANCKNNQCRSSELSWVIANLQDTSMPHLRTKLQHLKFARKPMLQLRTKLEHCKFARTLYTPAQN
jgi:hypothetical protein